MMQTIANTKVILETIKQTGAGFLTDFRKTRIPQNEDELMMALKAIEDQCLEMLKGSILPLYPAIPWVDDDEFDGNAQQKPAAYTRYWICDTMDGAIQYLQHIPGWTINLVLIENGEPVFSVIYDPLTDELFHAEKDKGAYLNGSSILSAEKQSEKIMVAVLEYGHQLKSSADWEQKLSSAFTRLLAQFGVVRNYGPHALQLAYIAASRIDLFVQYDLDTHNWLAGMLIAREAGAKILSTDGAVWKWGDPGLLVGASNAIAAYLGTK